jgi:hypothetical protein
MHSSKRINFFYQSAAWVIVRGVVRADSRKWVCGFLDEDGCPLLVSWVREGVSYDAGSGCNGGDRHDSGRVVCALLQELRGRARRYARGRDALREADGIREVLTESIALSRG